MKYFKIFLIVSAAVFGVSCTQVGSMAKKYNPTITGEEKEVSMHTWIVTADDKRYILTYKQIGEYIRGKIVAMDDINNENEISGKIVNRTINFQIYIMGRLTQEYDGILTKDAFKIKGTRTVDGRKGLEWSAENIDEKN